MKKFLLLLVIIMPFAAVKAQDTITFMNGTTAQAKVLAISQQDVQYKMWSNQDGPTYIMPKESIKSINFSNGMVQTFTSDESVTSSEIVALTPPPTATTSNNQDISQSITAAGTNISSSIDRTGGRIASNVGNLARQQDLYARARALEACGWVLGGLCFVGAMTWAITNIDEYEDSTPWGPILVGGLGSTAIVASFLIPASELESEAYSLSQVPIVQYNISDHLALDVRGFNHRPTDTKYFGVGVSMTF